MLPFDDALTNDDPISDSLDLESLKVWYKALLLICSNFWFLPVIIYAYKTSFYLEFAAIVVAMLYSILYHLCQTTDYCFYISLTKWTLADHISAGTMNAVLILFIVNLQSVHQLRKRLKLQAKRYESLKKKERRHEKEKDEEEERELKVSITDIYIANTVKSSPFLTHLFGFDLLQKHQFSFNSNSLLSRDINQNEDAKDLEQQYVINFDSEREENMEEEVRYSTYEGLVMEPNTIYDAWSTAIVYFYIFIVILAALAHPFSMQAFVIVILVGLVAIVFKIVIIDEGNPENMYGRIHLPDLIIGIILIVISIIFYVLDSYMLYWLFHPLWHTFCGLGLYFFIAGLTKNTYYWYSPTCKLTYIFLYCFCCIKERRRNRGQRRKETD